MKRKVKKMCTGLVMSMAFVIATVGTVYGMTQYGHYDISTITETGIRAWAYKKSPYKSASAKVTEAGRSSGWKTGRDVKATLTNLPFYVSKTYYKYNKEGIDVLQIKIADMFSRCSIFFNSCYISNVYKSY